MKDRNVDLWDYVLAGSLIRSKLQGEQDVDNLENGPTVDVESRSAGCSEVFSQTKLAAM